YNKWLESKAKDDRPAIVHRMTEGRSLRVAKQDGSRGDLIDLRNKVVAIQVIHLDQAEDSVRSTAVLKRLAETYAEEDDFRIVTLVLNPGSKEELDERLSTAAAELGASLPQWWVSSTKPEVLRKFIRKELKPSLPPAQVDGRWVFDSSITLMDRNGHIRRAVVPQKAGGSPYIAAFDFDQAAQWDEEGIKTGTDLNNQEQLEVLLADTIDKLLLEELERKSHWPTVIGVLILALLVCFVIFLRVFRAKNPSLQP
ncbi:MAG: hypothetical protein R3242_10190, partial [Akkermansiaceae bacterium]|nr:hypothetical protein [Akkermansiaceae bacterium]